MNTTTQVTRELTTVTQQGAQALVSAAFEAAAAQSLNISVAIHDAGGNLLAFGRMDDAPELTIEIAQNKSYTAIAFGMPTHQWFELIKDDEELKLGIVHTPRLTTFGGGVPIVANGRPIGAIGISGGHYSQDMDVASEALKACGLSA